MKMINPDYVKLAQIAYDTVLRTMQEGEKDHGKDEWKKLPVAAHLDHADTHIQFQKIDYALRDKEDHIAHALTRCAMIKYLETR